MTKSRMEDYAVGVTNDTELAPQAEQVTVTHLEWVAKTAESTPNIGFTVKGLGNFNIDMLPYSMHENVATVISKLEASGKMINPVFTLTEGRIFKIDIEVSTIDVGGLLPFVGLITHSVYNKNETLEA